ncbi:MAG: replication initiator protein A [Anaeromassilibacillus sp.]
MRAAKMKERPTFQLMCQTDVQSIYHTQMPRWLFSDPRYCEMSLDAKVTYTFLLNRFQLSRKNGWVNDRGEVFVIFPRKALAKELHICEQRVTAAFKKLVELKLVWEKRCGRGDANQIYLARVTPIEDPDYSCAPFITEDESEDRASRTSTGPCDGNRSIQNRRICCQKYALQELQNPRRTEKTPEKKERLIKVIWKSVRLSEPQRRTDRRGRRRRTFGYFGRLRA